MDVREAAEALATYAVGCGLTEPGDLAWSYNRILECVGAWGPGPTGRGEDAPFDLDATLAVLADEAVANGTCEDSATGRDRAAMRVMGVLVPRPSEVAAVFDALLSEEGPDAALGYLYQLSCDANYVRRSAIARNVAWEAPTRWGTLEITINLSKPEKDPRDIAAAGRAPAGEAYPACQLCMENEGYSGRPAALGGHPARQNLRVVPIELGGERWGLQYSPYAYFNEHCIAMSAEHRPMHVDRASLACLLDFLDLLPVYFIGSNADLPVVGGSILSHDHFQGGRHRFPMMAAPLERRFGLAAFPQVEAGVVRWPLTAVRLRSADRAQLLDAACHVLDAWRGWSDEAVGVVAADADGTPHNTVTPIAWRCGHEYGDGGFAEAAPAGAYVLDLVLRCNVTSEEHPLGVFHPHEDKWRVKKENIGLIEVMGEAILPPRLLAEMESGELSRDEVGQTFAGVLEDAGVFKWDDSGRAALGRFLAAL